MGNVTKLLVDGFKWVSNTSRFKKEFIENYSQDNDKVYVVEIDVQ